ncbi:MAG: DUF2889 domain-containing protein [Syntrophaceae bacterium]
MADLKRFRTTPLHVRGINATTYPVDDDAIMVEGVLKDERLIPTLSLIKGGMSAPGVVHDITIRLLIRGAAMVIEDLEVEITHVPRELCRETQAALQPLIGHHIAPGFSEYIKKTFGGKKGCAHQNALLLTMASAAVQGFWAQRAGNKNMTIDAARSRMDPRLLINTCWVWREDGELIKELAAALQEQSGVS